MEKTIRKLTSHEEMRLHQLRTWQSVSIPDLIASKKAVGRTQNITDIEEILKAYPFVETSPDQRPPKAIDPVIRNP